MKLYYLPRTAIEAKILFAARVMQVRFLKRLSGKTPPEQNSSGEKIGAESAVLHFVFFEVIVNEMQQSAKESGLLKSKTMPEIFPLTAILAGSGKTMPFEKRHAGCEEREKINRRRIYDTLRINFFEATKQTACIFSKGEETGVNYYGARYLDPKYSRWLSGDPALNDYIPKAPIDDEAKKHNENLPGMGGVYNIVNMHLYHYAGNNPVKYTDPDGRDIETVKETIRISIDLGKQVAPLFEEPNPNNLMSEAKARNKINDIKGLTDKEEEKLNFRKGLLQEIENKKDHYVMKGLNLFEITDMINNNSVFITNIKNNDKNLTVTVVSDNEKRITQLIKDISKMPKYSVNTKKIKEDKQNNEYESNISIEIRQ